MTRTASLETRTLDSTALADALDRVRELSLRLWAVREAHPVGRDLLGRLRCRACAHAWPCPTVRATQVYDDGEVLRSSS